MNVESQTPASTVLTVQLVCRVGKKFGCAMLTAVSIMMSFSPAARRARHRRLASTRLSTQTSSFFPSSL